MKICVTSIDENGTAIDPHFGRTLYFLIFNKKGEIKKTIKNPGREALRGAGSSAAQVMANEKIDAIITGNIGPNAFNLLTQTGIKIYSVSLGVNPREAVNLLNKEKLSEVKFPAERFGGRGGGYGRRSRGGL